LDVSGTYQPLSLVRGRGNQMTDGAVGVRLISSAAECLLCAKRTLMPVSKNLSVQLLRSGHIGQATSTFSISHIDEGNICVLPWSDMLSVGIDADISAQRQRQ